MSIDDDAEPCMEEDDEEGLTMEQGDKDQTAPVELGSGIPTPRPGAGQESRGTSSFLAQIRNEIHECLEDLQSVASLGPDDVLVVGASSSEIIGKRIGTATSADVGRSVVEAVLEFQQQTGCQVAFQCCEHLNRALVVSKTIARQRGWTEVSAVPVPGAGGAVASHAYFALQDACLVESIVADAGIDVGDTFIGMHLRRVAVPVRVRRTEIGSAHVTLARTRPPLIGGTRAVYDVEEAKRRLFPSDNGAAREDC